MLKIVPVFFADFQSFTRGYATARLETCPDSPLAVPSSDLAESVTHTDVCVDGIFPAIALGPFLVEREVASVSRFSI